MINRARQPVILADVEVHRFALQDVLLKLVAQNEHSRRGNGAGQIRHRRAASVLPGRL